MLVWTDLETTGLKPRQHTTLEVAVIVTDDTLAEVARFERVVHYPNARWLQHLKGDESDEVIAPFVNRFGIDPVVIRMHAKSGLWAACWNSLHSLHDADVELALFLEATSVVRSEYEKDGEKKTYVDRAQLAGSTISFDRGFMAEDLPKSLEVLHYRNVDVSTLNELGRRFWTALYEKRPRKSDGVVAHRGMADIEDSLAVCRYYIAGLLPLLDKGSTPLVGVP